VTGIIRPGATIGILGGGQLGRMTAMAARTLGYNVHILDPDANCAAGAVADRVVAARFDDADAAKRNSDLPETDALAQTMMAKAIGEPTFTDFDVKAERTY